MTTPATPPNSKSAGDDRHPVASDNTPAALGFEEKVHLFWKQNSTAVLAVCALVLAGIIVKGVWDYLAEQRELDVQKAYAAATVPDKLKAFVVEHPDHPLAGVASLQLADEAYKTGRNDEALVNYDRTVAVLKTGPLADRAKMGAAMSRIAAGKTAEGQAGLQQLANDKGEPASLRAEAAYQLASLAVTAGNDADVKAYTTLLMQINPSSPWAQRAMMLQIERTAAPATTAAVQAEAKPAAGVQFQLPGK